MRRWLAAHCSWHVDRTPLLHHQVLDEHLARPFGEVGSHALGATRLEREHSAVLGGDARRFEVQASDMQAVSSKPIATEVRASRAVTPWAIWVITAPSAVASVACSHRLYVGTPHTPSRVYRHRSISRSWRIVSTADVRVRQGIARLLMRAHVIVAAHRGFVTTELAGLADSTAANVERRYRRGVDAILDGIVAGGAR